MPNWIYYIIAALVAYLIGSFSSSYVISRIKKVDLKKTATQNLGASNTTVVLGWRYGVLVGAADIAKGALAVLLTRFALPAIAGISLDVLPGIAYLAAAAPEVSTAMIAAKLIAGFCGLALAIALAPKLLK